MHPSDYQPIVSLSMSYQDILDLITRPMIDELIFRGVKDSAYGLVPSAYRRNGMKKLYKEARTYMIRCGSWPLHDKQSTRPEFREIMALLWFYDLANRQGLRVPDIPHAYSGNRYRDALSLSKTANAHFVEDWSEIAAVAQHHGVPTRMLDWTFDVDVALYFAVKDLPRKSSEAKHPEAVSLWVLNKTKAAMLRAIRFVVPKYCDNPNIRAQSGLFTVLDTSLTNPGTDLQIVVLNEYLGADDDALQVIESGNSPVLTRMDIPYEDALELKANFKNRSISYDSIFPGWSGVAESIEIQSDLKGGSDSFNDFMRSHGSALEPYSPPVSHGSHHPPTP